MAEDWPNERRSAALLVFEKGEKRPHNSVVHKIGQSILDDPDQRIIVWQPYLKKR